MQLLHDLIEDLERQRAVLDERLRLAAELLNTYDPTDAETKLAPTVEVVKAEPPAKPKGSERVACPDCGELFAAQGLGVHRSRKHPDSAAKPLRIVKGDRDPKDTFGEEFFACSSCNHEEPNLAGLKRHTLVEHGRPVVDVERKAIPA